MGSSAVASNWHAALSGVFDTSANPAQSPVIHAIPPAGSSASFWFTADNSGADTIFSIDAPVGSILDFDLEFNHGMPPAIGSFTYPIATGTLGVMYWLSYVPTAGTGQITPVMLATTI